MCYKLVILAPQLARGRLRVFHSPNSRPGFNASYSAPAHTIVDVNGTTEVIIKCPYVGSELWLKTGNIESQFTASYDASRDSGAVYIDILDGLQLPSGTSVDILWYMWCEDMEVAQLDMEAFNSYYFGCQKVSMQGVYGDEAIMEEHTDIRELIKIPCQVQRVNISAVDTGINQFVCFSEGRIWRNLVGQALWPTSTSQLPNAVPRNSLLNYFTCAFLFRKGGIRHKFHNIAIETGTESQMKYAYMRKNTTAAPMFVFTDSLGAAAYQTELYNVPFSTQSGIESLNMTVVSRELTPGYFYNSQYPQPTPTGVSSTEATTDNYLVLFSDYTGRSTSTEFDIFTVHQSAADDFSLSCFQHFPVLFV